MKIVIVGGTGGIGRALGRFMASRGASILVVGQTFRDSDVSGIEFVRADLSLMREAQRVATELPAETFDLFIFSNGIFSRSTTTHLSQIASWADFIRTQRRETGPWHYVNIPLGAQNYDAARDCPHDDCVVARITLFAAVLAERGAEPRIRLEALKFITHFVGDLHQPLHAEDNNDAGGNRIRVANFPRNASLHSIWDYDMVEAHDPDAGHFALRLDASISHADIEQWEIGTPADWANESHALAVDAYARLDNPGAGAVIAVSNDYVRAELPVIELQLKRAGIRLATELNRTLEEP